MGFLRPKNQPISPFLVSHLKAPEDVATKRGEDCPDNRSTVVQDFMPIRCTAGEISVPGQKKIDRITLNLIHSILHVASN